MLLQGIKIAAQGAGVWYRVKAVGVDQGGRDENRFAGCTQVERGAGDTGLFRNGFVGQPGVAYPADNVENGLVDSGIEGSVSRPSGTSSRHVGYAALFW